MGQHVDQQSYPCYSSLLGTNQRSKTLLLGFEPAPLPGDRWSTIENQ